MPDHRTVIRVDEDGTRTGLAVMKTRYRIVQNEEGFAFAQSLVDDFSAKAVAVAAYGKPVGARAFIALRLERAMLINDTDVHHIYVRPGRHRR